MTHTVFPALRGLRAQRRLPGFACFLGALAMAILAGCGSSSSCSGGGSGYQVDGLPGLMSCNNGSGSGNSTDTIVQGMTMSFDGMSLDHLAAFTSQAQTNSSYAAITSITSTTTSGLSGSMVSYTVAVPSTPGYTVGFVYCSLQGASMWWWNTTSLALTTGMNYTLSVTYPTFTMSPVVLECQYLDSSQAWWSNVAMGPSSTP